jgi:tetratricopeptide (TPR) repeat protein
VTTDGIDRANRTVSKQFHPDQFINQPAEVRRLAAECFSVLQDAYDAMKDEGMRKEVRARLEAAERGEQYVTDRDRAEADVLYSRGQVIFRKKEYSTAKKKFQSGLSRDPNNWRCAYMLLRSRYHLNELGGEDAAQQIQDLDGPRGLVRADVLFEVAEIFMRDGAKRRAHETYDAVLKLNPEHIGARRRLRIKSMRAAAAGEEAGSGMFSGLFRRKKK